jgi:hypothetical protein
VRPESTIGRASLLTSPLVLLLALLFANAQFEQAFKQALFLLNLRQSIADFAVRREKGLIFGHASSLRGAVMENSKLPAKALQKASSVATISKWLS